MPAEPGQIGLNKVCSFMHRTQGQSSLCSSPLRSAGVNIGLQFCSHVYCVRLSVCHIV